MPVSFIFVRNPPTEIGIHQPGTPTEPLQDQTGISMGRSDGFEQKCFQHENERKRWGTESYAWDVDDIKTEKTKIRVQRKDKNRTRADQRKVYSRQETVVYFPKSDKESTNRG